LFNVVKHADVSEASVTVTRDDEEIRIQVQDEGAGFYPELLSQRNDPSSGFGIYSVHERLGLFDGRLELVSAPGEGTLAVITVPLERSRP
jgi:signal transduction histidine kinase